MSSKKKHKITFADSVRDYIRSLKASGRAPSTLESYRSKLALLDEITGHACLNQITETVLENAVLKIQNGYPATLPRRATSMNQYRIIIRSFFSWCMATGKIRKNPSIHLRMSRSATQERTTAIQPNELNLFFAAMRISHHPLALRDETMFALCAYAGLRRHEAVGLHIGDLKHDQKIMIVPKTKSGEFERRVIATCLSKILNRYLVWRTPPGGLNQDLWLFPGRNDKHHLVVRQANERFQYWIQQSGLSPELTIHSLRAGFATRLHRETHDDLLVARALGHTYFPVSERYITLHEDQIRSAIDRIY